jgi:hypothetical protein
MIEEDCEIIPELTGWACICDNESSVALTRSFKMLSNDRVVRIVECKTMYGLVEETERGPIIVRRLIQKYPSFDDALIASSAYQTVYERTIGRL